MVSFFIYKFISFGNKEPQIVPASQLADDEKIQIIKSSKKSKIIKPEPPDLKTDLEKIWARVDKEIPVASYLEELLQEAENGNPYAKYHLAYVQRFCSGAAISEESLDIQISQIEQENRKQFLIDKYIYCESFPQNMFSTKDIKNMIIDAARLGNPKAKLEFAAVAFDVGPLHHTVKNAELLVDLKKEAMQHYIDAKNMGEEGALYWLGLAYKNGELTNQNYIEAYAYYSALRSINSNYSERNLLNIEENLTEKEILLAIQKGENYAKCCS